jgi:hypothetical protein
MRSDEYYSRGYDVDPYYRDNQRWVNIVCFYHIWLVYSYMSQHCCNLCSVYFPVKVEIGMCCFVIC